MDRVPESEAKTISQFNGVVPEGGITQFNGVGCVPESEAKKISQFNGVVPTLKYK